MNRCVIALAMLLSTPAAATVTYSLNYSGTLYPQAGVFQPYHETETGIGFFELKDESSTASLANGLVDFGITTNLTGTSDFSPDKIYRTNVYTLADLTAFDVQTVNDQVVSLSFFVNKGANGANLSVFSLSYVQSQPFGPGNQPLYGSITANVPEPLSWALIVAGFGAVGLGMRRRRVLVAA